MENHEHTDAHTDKISESINSADLSQQVFSNPADFLQTLRKDFKEISLGKDKITLEDLLAESKNGTTIKDRQAAAIAASHMSELAGIAGQQDIRMTPSNSITMQDLTWASDMNDHRTLKYTAENIGTDLVTAATIGALGAATGGAGILELKTGVGLFGAAASVATEALWIGAGVGGIAFAGYLGYEAFKENSRITTASKKDSLMFSSWLKSPASL